MTKDVLLSISGLHYDVTGMVQEEENEPIEVICLLYTSDAADD